MSAPKLALHLEEESPKVAKSLKYEMCPAIQDPISDSHGNKHNVKPKGTADFKGSVLLCRAQCTAPAPAAAGTKARGSSLPLLGSLQQGLP